MKLRLICLLALVALSLAACRNAADAVNVAAQSKANPGERIQRVENGLLPAVSIKGQTAAMKLVERMAHYKVPGLSVAVINDGKIEWARGYGVIEKDGNQPITPDTRFLAGSISKPVAALAALRLVEQGKLSLDEDVNLKLKTWRVPENEFTTEQKVTLRRLLSHSAGLTVHGFPGYAVDAPMPALAQILNGEKPANTAAIRVDIVPGSRWRYSGGGYTVMQQLMMDVTGKSFPELTRELVLAPIGMRQSTYENPPPKAFEAAAATAHRASGEKVKGRWHVYPEMAAAGLWTTASDLAHYAIEVQRALAGQSKILSREMAQQMVTVQKGSSGLGPALENPGKESARFGHGGVDEGFEASLMAYCQSGRGAVVMMNANRAMPLAGELMRAIAKEYAWPDYLEPERVVAKVDPSVYAACAGQYELTPTNTATVTVENGRIFLQPTGQTKEELFPESETTFFPIVQAGMRITFVKDAEGKVTELVLRQGNQERKAKKIK
jgi:CubicO group peptidase (beta-lactamase class C family)